RIETVALERDHKTAGRPAGLVARAGEEALRLHRDDLRQYIDIQCVSTRAACAVRRSYTKDVHNEHLVLSGNDAEGVAGAEQIAKEITHLHGNTRAALELEMTRKVKDLRPGISHGFGGHTQGEKGVFLNGVDSLCLTERMDDGAQASRALDDVVDDKRRR